MATFDSHKNFSYSTVLTAPSPASSGTSLVVQSADGAKFPSVSFNAVVWPAGVRPTTTNAEVVRVTNIATDTFTITRTQESSSARSVIVGDQIAAVITNKTFTDIETLFPTGTVVGTTDSQTLTNKEVSGGVIESNDFMDNISTQSISLPASRSFRVLEDFELASGHTLEVPATTTLEVLTYEPYHSGPATARVSTSETTTSTTYADLTTVTDSVTVNIGPKGLALVELYCGTIQNDTQGDYAVVAFAVSGANTIAAADSGANMFSLKLRNSAAGGVVGDWAFGASQLLTGLTAGITTFKMKYKVAVGGTGTFAERKISVIPL